MPGKASHDNPSERPSPLPTRPSGLFDGADCLLEPLSQLLRWCLASQSLPLPPLLFPRSCSWISPHWLPRWEDCPHSVALNAISNEDTELSLQLLSHKLSSSQIAYLIFWFGYLKNISISKKQKNNQTYSENLTCEHRGKVPKESLANQIHTRIPHVEGGTMRTSQSLASS